MKKFALLSLLYRLIPLALGMSTGHLIYEFTQTHRPYPLVLAVIMITAGVVYFVQLYENDKKEEE